MDETHDMDETHESVVNPLRDAVERLPRWRTGAIDPWGRPVFRVDRGRNGGVVELAYGDSLGWCAVYHRDIGAYSHVVALRTRTSDRNGADAERIGRSIPDPEDFALGGDPVEVLRSIERFRDRALLDRPEVQDLVGRLSAAFTECATAPGDPWESGGSLDLPEDGYVQWTRVAETGSPVHVEVSDGTDYSLPLPEDLVRMLEDLGWQRPDEDFRNAWARAATSAERTLLAELVVRTVQAVFGVPR